MQVAESKIADLKRSLAIAGLDVKSIEERANKLTITVALPGARLVWCDLYQVESKEIDDLCETVVMAVRRWEH